MKQHKLASLIPEMSQKEYESLKADIAAHGLNEHIWTYQDKILDGRHRHRACVELGVRPRFKEYRGTAPASFVLGQNLNRRHLNASQLAAVGAELAPLIEKEEGGNKAKTEGAKKGGQAAGRGRPQIAMVPIETKANGRGPRSSDKAAVAVGASGGSVRRAIAVKQQAPEVFEEVKAGTKNLHQAEREVKRRQKAAELQAKAKAVNRNPKAMDSKVICGDCLELLPTISGARLIFSDPPYNIGIDYGSGSKADKLPAEKFVAWCGQWIAVCHKALAKDGSLWVMINDDWADHIGIALRQAGFHRRAWIKWYETFGVNCQDNFNRTSRHIFYCVKDRKRFVFNAAAVNRPSDRQAKYRDKRASPEGKVWDDVWQIARLTDNNSERMPFFPTQVPLDILRPIVGCASDPGDLVIDPFSGSGTTGVACRELQRRFIGIERNQDYADRSMVRIASTETNP